MAGGGIERLMPDLRHLRKRLAELLQPISSLLRLTHLNSHTEEFTEALAGLGLSKTYPHPKSPDVVLAAPQAAMPVTFGSSGERA